MTATRSRTTDGRSEQAIAAPVRLIISDVDGVLTDGRIIYDSGGVETKCFHVRDGLGIKLWQRCGFHFAILSARSSPAVAARAAELAIERVLQGIESKWPAAEQLITELGLTPDQTCYIGDDLADLSVMRRVGLAAPVADASDDVRARADWTLRLPGGAGAVRELIERLLRAQSRWEQAVAAAYP